MLTWSSCMLLDTMESTEAGVANCLFWLAMEAAVYWGIISPECRPGFGVRNMGSSLFPEMSW